MCMYMLSTPAAHVQTTMRMKMAMGTSTQTAHVRTTMHMKTGMAISTHMASKQTARVHMGMHTNMR